jgi:hypothetical protein
VALREDRATAYRLAATLALNQWSLAGRWTVGAEYAQADAPGGQLVFRFHARDLHLVLGPAADGHPVRFRVQIDGHEPGQDHGADVDEHGEGSVGEQRLYQLIRQSGSIGEHTFSIQFLDGSARAYSFTFG